MISDPDTTVVKLWFREAGSAWFGIAERGERLVATCVESSRDKAERLLCHCLPAHARAEVGEGYSSYADRMALMLAALEADDESTKRFELDEKLIGESAARIYRLVAAIPIGWASSYGRVALAAGSIARAVGTLMANNPLYPIVPCHRVVGSDLSLVGYRGQTSGPDLDDKLARLRSERRGFTEEMVLPGTGGLVVFPAEWVVAKAEAERKSGAGEQLPLF